MNLNKTNENYCLTHYCLIVFNVNAGMRPSYNILALYRNNVLNQNEVSKKRGLSIFDEEFRLAEVSMFLSKL
jgi:hypothetical protein